MLYTVKCTMYTIPWGKDSSKCRRCSYFLLFSLKRYKLLFIISARYFFLIKSACYMYFVLDLLLEALHLCVFCLSKVVYCIIYICLQKPVKNSIFSKVTYKKFPLCPVRPFVPYVLLCRVCA